MAGQVADTNITFEVYNNARRMIGIAEVTLPNAQPMTAEVKGSGMSGTIDKPVLGQFQSMTLTINWRTITDEGGVQELMEPRSHHLEFWAATQRSAPDQGGRYVVKQHKIIVAAEPKNLTIGKLGVAENQDRSLEMEVSYLREFYDGNETLEIDKYNSVYRVNGQDMYADVRAAVGL